MRNELVRHSRAGDVFHYRWAARRCLKMIHPNSPIYRIVIENAYSNSQAGVYVIDVAEYKKFGDPNLTKTTYYQLKHTSKRQNQPFVLSDLKNTIEGFAESYKETHQKSDDRENIIRLNFSIITNRPIKEYVKNNLALIRDGKKASKRFQKTLEKYTNLARENLRTFCCSLTLNDGEGDYKTQRHDLRLELSQILAGPAINTTIDSIVALVQERALPDSDGIIVREDILKRLGFTSTRDLFPAPLNLEALENTIPRIQLNSFLSAINDSSNPIIIHAAGGVGKTILARQLSNSVENGSIGIIYDCFGGGRYRNRSEPRHRHRDALVQVTNELATLGLCSPLIAQTTALDDQILRDFLSHTETAINSLRRDDENAKLIVIVDAADNAVLAADEFGDSCFAIDLLREELPDGFRLVVTCRTERLEMLNPPDPITCLELKPFNQTESLSHLRTRFPNATDADGLEFHRLTNGNPRVQANSLRKELETLDQVLSSLGPSGTTVDDQIKEQLNSAISTISVNIPFLVPVESRHFRTFQPDIGKEVSLPMHHGA